MDKPVENESFSDEILDADFMSSFLRKGIWIRSAYSTVILGMIVILHFFYESLPLYPNLAVQFYSIFMAIPQAYLARFKTFYRKLAFYLLSESVILHTLTMHFFGGIEAIGLVMVYLVLIQFSGIFSRRWPFFIANFSWIVASLSFWLAQWGVIQRHHFLLSTTHIDSKFIILVTILMFFFFNFGALMANMILDILRLQNKLLNQFQQKMIQEEKMAELGRLSADVAHEIRNPLSIIQNQLHTLPSNPSTSVVLERIFKQIERIKNFVKRLLIYSRAHKLSLERVPLDGVIVSALEYALESAQAEQRIQVERRFSKLPPIVGDANLLQQCFVNLFTNAIEAIRGEGKITVETGKEKEEVCVKIQDTGRGIPEGDLERIFEPFYSAKADAVEGGTGLGLAIVKEVIHHHGGAVSVKSQWGQGTTFTIRLPMGTGSLSGHNPASYRPGD
ncbi:MAG: GHKL domain-containing protein [Deltaproteobacteria bacterium]|nr:GHKL domain-containing protein [Deltaproteobacteria bacterium]